MNILKASVGEKGSNNQDDVQVVQSLLNSKGFTVGKVDGRCGPKTIGAICKFQASFMSKPDGLIEPNCTSWKKLSSTTTRSTNANLLQWNGDSAEWSQSKKLLSLHPNLQH